MLVLSLSLSSSNSDVLEKSQYLSAVFSCTAKRKKKKNIPRVWSATVWPRFTLQPLDR